MDPFSALAIAASVVQFLDFTSKILIGSTEIAKVITETSNGKFEHTDLRKATERLSELSKELQLRNRYDLRAHTSAHEQVIIALARESEEVAQQIITVLNRQNCLQALKAAWKDDYIRSLQTKLDGVRGQLTLHLLAVIRDEAFSSHTDLKEQISELHKFTAENFLNRVNDSNNWMQFIAKEIRHQNAIDAAFVEDTFVPSRLAKAGLEPKSKEFADLILSSLRFQGMGDRHDTIVEAHQDTFEWIFSDDKSHGDWKSFPTWLRNPSGLYWITGIYWITGKPGAGKSTLMKFLYDDPRTLRFVSQSSDLQVVDSAFFFWNSGQSMQMSQKGLVQSLLWQMLSRCKEYAPIAFPDRWEMYGLLGKRPFDRWTWNEILRGFYRLVEKAGSHNRFFYLIDGLDEYDGNHPDLIKFLNKICMLPNVKMCVSSRPWIVFEEAFQSSPSLQVHKLTYPDIKKYVETHFHENRGYKELELEEPMYAAQLVEEITNKSAGVFLWVAVVVKSLLSGVTNGDRISDLQKRLDALPPDLEDLFHNILHSLDPAYKQQAFQLFRIFRAAKKPITMIEMAFADECDATQVLNQTVGLLPESQIQAKVGRMRRRLVSRCRCLLEVVGRNQLRADAFVQYLHRTVKDFMEKDSIWIGIVSKTPAQYDPCLQLCLSDLMQLKTVDNGKPTMVYSLFRWCIQYAGESSVTATSTGVELLDELNRAMQVLAMRDNTVRVSFRRGLSEDPLRKYWTQLDNPNPTPFINMMIHCRLAFYVKAKLDQGYSIKRSEPLAPVLFGGVYGGVNSNEPLYDGLLPSNYEFDIDLVKLLLDHGADPYALYHERSWLDDCRDSYPENSDKLEALVKLYPVEGLRKVPKAEKKGCGLSLKNLRLRRNGPAKKGAGYHLAPTSD